MVWSLTSTNLDGWIRLWKTLPWDDAFLLQDKLTSQGSYISDVWLYIVDASHKCTYLFGSIIVQIETEGCVKLYI